MGADFTNGTNAASGFDLGEKYFLAKLNKRLHTGLRCAESQLKADLAAGDTAALATDKVALEAARKQLATDRAAALSASTAVAADKAALTAARQTLQADRAAVTGTMTAQAHEAGMGRSQGARASGSSAGSAGGAGGGHHGGRH